MPTSSRNPVLVIGVGNEFRRDDAAGLYAARQLQAAAPPGVDVRIESGEGAALIDAWSGYHRVFAIDATSSNFPPGTIHRLDAHDRPIPSEFFHYSTHAFSLAEAVELARALGQLPTHFVIYGIEGNSFSAGQGLSPEVLQAAGDVALRIQSEITDQMAADRKSVESC